MASKAMAYKEGNNASSSFHFIDQSFLSLSTWTGDSLGLLTKAPLASVYYVVRHVRQHSTLLQRSTRLPPFMKQEDLAP